MDFHTISIQASLFLYALLNCRSTNVSCGTQNDREALLPRVRRNVSNKTVSSSESYISSKILATTVSEFLTNGIVRETIENNEVSTPLTTESTTSGQKSEIDTKSNMSDVKQLTSNVFLTNDPREVTEVDSSSSIITVHPTPNITGSEETTPSESTKHTQSITQESTINIQTTATAFSNLSVQGNEHEKLTDNIDIQPIDKLPNEKKVNKLEGNRESYADSTTKAIKIDSTKTTTAKIKSTVSNKITTTLSAITHRNDDKVTSNSRSISTERSGDDKVFGDRRTALSNGKDIVANIEDENVESTTTHLVDSFDNTTSHMASDASSTSNKNGNTILDEIDKSTLTSKSVTLDTKSETPTSKPDVTTSNNSEHSTNVTGQVARTTTHKTYEAKTKTNDRTTALKPTTPATDKEKGANNTAKDLIKPGSNESMFGKYGLAMFIAACAVILCLVLVIIYISLSKKRKRKEDDFMVGNSVPKLKMLEVRNSSLPSNIKPGNTSNKEDLPTYSLDYEKHVQEKIEEHRKLVQTKSQNPTLPGAEPTPLAGVSSFKIERKPSAASGTKRPSQKSRSGSQSGPTSPATPTYPEGRPLLDKSDEPVVFNFAKKPGEATAAREARAARRGSAPNAGNKMKSVTKSKDDYFGVNV